VAILFEPAAAPAGDANRTGGGNLTIDLLVKFDNLPAQRCGHRFVPCWSSSNSIAALAHPIDAVVGSHAEAIALQMKAKFFLASARLAALQ
jgi:hypothetical protein